MPVYPEGKPSPAKTNWHSQVEQATLNSFLPLQSQRIDIWEFALKPYQASYSSILNADERKRADAFHFQKHRERFIQARGTLRHILAAYLDSAPLALEFDYGLQGKPGLVNNTQGLEFNLSHSRDRALLAVGQGYPLGIDLEYFSARPYFGIAEKLFSPTELTALQQLPESLTALGFFSFWTQKEALVKASGLGLSYPTESLSLACLPDRCQQIFEPITAMDYCIETFMPAPLLSAALCYHPRVKQLRWLRLS